MHQSSSGAAEYRPWSKHSKGSSRYAKLHQQKEQHDEDRISADTGNKKSKLGVKRDDNVDEEAVETNRKRDEFLSAMGVSTSSEQGGVISVAPFVHWSFSILSDHRTSHSCGGTKSHHSPLPKQTLPRLWCTHPIQGKAVGRSSMQIIALFKTYCHSTTASRPQHHPNDLNIPVQSIPPQPT